jgi:hypothetical protein
MSKVFGVSIIVATLTIAGSESGDALSQNKLSTIDGIQVVCTGVGSSKSNPRWSSLPIKLVFADRRGEFTAGENIVIRQGRHSILQTSCDAPWLLLKPFAGRYRVNATLQDYNSIRHASGTFSTSGKGSQKTVTLEFPMAKTG